MGDITVSRRSVMKWMGLLGVSTLAGCSSEAEPNDLASETVLTSTNRPSPTASPSPTRTPTATEFEAEPAGQWDGQTSTPVEQPSPSPTTDDTVTLVEHTVAAMTPDDRGDREIIFEGIVETKADLAYLRLTVYWYDKDGVRVDEGADSTRNLDAGERWQAVVSYSPMDESDTSVDEMERYKATLSWRLA